MSGFEVAFVLVPPLVYALTRWLGSTSPGKPGGATAPSPGGSSGEDPVAGPAYPWLVEKWTKPQRALLVETARKLNLNPSALATIFQLESRGDPTVPTKAEGTPRGGLIQITVGARMPGLDTAEKVWKVREWSIEQQLERVVGPFLERYKGRTPDWSAFELYKRNFLPGVASKSNDFVIARKDSSEPLIPGQPLTLGAIYAANPGFDPGGKGFYTWGDVEQKVSAQLKSAGGKVVTVSGVVKDASSGPAPATTPTDGSPAKIPAVAPALKILLRQINDGWPQRSKASDGGLGDKAHDERCKAAGTGSGLCDHSEGRAIDITLDEANGPPLDELAELLRKDPRTRYLIWKRRISNPTIENGAWRPYDGSPHDRHLHLSVLESARNDERPWTLPSVASPRVLKAIPNVVDGWLDGQVDNVFWTPLVLGPYRVNVATDALSYQGVRIPVTFDDMLRLGRDAHYLPTTKKIADARWAAAVRKVPLDPLGVPGSPELEAKWPGLDAQAREWSRRLGPKPVQPTPGYTGLTDGAWKEWILTDALQPGRAVNYGLRRADGSVWQKPASAHASTYRDYSQLWAPVHRTALKNGVEVDLVEELSRGAPELMDGVLPSWVVEKLR